MVLEQRVGGGDDVIEEAEGVKRHHETSAPVRDVMANVHGRESG
jgi:hypothetical protein